MIIIGLTGSIGMGKSTAAKIFEEHGAPVFDSDAFVHQLYDVNGAAVALFAQDKDLSVTVDKDDKGRAYINRGKLKEIFYSNAKIKEKVEHIVHSLVRLGQDQFIEDARRQKYTALVMDIPLLFETDGHLRCDYVVVVSAPKHIQEKRVLKRPGMTAEKLKEILAAQIPDHIKRQRADFVINSTTGISDARRQIKKILKDISPA